jgi:hypothetical protein
VSSEDCDVLVRVPFALLTRVTNNMLVLNKELDALLGKVIETEKVINSCFGCVCKLCFAVFFLFLLVT